MTEERPEDRERWQVLHELEDWLEWPMLVLAAVWFALFIAEVTRGLTPFLIGVTTIIWVVFIADFALRLFLAPDKGRYLRRNWLVGISLVVPALRVFRVFRAIRLLRAARVVRGARLVRAVSSINRGIRALGGTMRRRGFGYVVAATILVMLLGAAGILGLESGIPGGRFTGYGAALWWTAMMMTTMGADFWPVTSEGRVLAVLLALYAFAMFGYVTATLATYFVGQEAESRETEIASATSIQALHAEVSALRAELAGRGSMARDPEARG